MARPEVESFVAALVRNVRDDAVGACDRTTRRASIDGKPMSHDDLVVECVDAALGYLLLAIDHRVLDLRFTTSTGATIDPTHDGEGELTGWYMGTNGFRDTYATERFIDYFADLGSKDDPPRHLLSPPIEELVAALITKVRDRAVRICDGKLRRAATEHLIIDYIDETIGCFLDAIDQRLLVLQFVTRDGRTIDLAECGEGRLAATYRTCDGFLAKYATQRFIEQAPDGNRVVHRIFCHTGEHVAVDVPSLTGADLSGLELHRADLMDRNLTGTVFRGANLRGAFLNRSCLRWAVLDDARMQVAQLVGADLRGATLRRARMNGAILHEANLDGADLRGAMLAGADLAGARLAGARLDRGALSDDQLAGARDAARVVWADPAREE